MQSYLFSRFSIPHAWYMVNNYFDMQSLKVFLVGGFFEGTFFPDDIPDTERSLF